MNQQSYPLTITELHQGYRSGSLTPEALFADIRENVKSCDDYNIWIHLLNEDELEKYFSNLADKNPDNLPLYGIPFAIKDNIDLEGIPTTAACPEFSYVPEKNAFVVQLLIDAGAIPVGKTNLDQFATGLVGTRSPHGAVKNAFNKNYISGGSSSGSAVAVALGQACFSLGTDTAGSGRIPAAFNNLIGVKPTRGRVSTSGVVPACRSLDCVSLFALNPDDATAVFRVMDKYDPEDIYSKPATEITENQSVKIGIVKSEHLQFFGNKEYEYLYKEFVENIPEEQCEIVEIDFSPFIEAANLLYQGPWVAERYAAIESLVENNPDALFPVTREIISPARGIDAVDAFKNFYQLQDLKKQADRILREVDFILTPTAGTHYSIDEVNNDPVQSNSNLGYYTNFMNLLDYSALAIPAGFNKKGLPFGVTLFADAFRDENLLNQAVVLLNGKLERMGCTENAWLASRNFPENREKDIIDIAVCGAHLSGMALNHQLLERNATLKVETRTARAYRFYALAGGPPYRPGLVRDEEQGEHIELEVWSMPVNKFGSFMLSIPAPLGIGSVELEDGDWVNGFICEAYGIEGAKEITHLKSWRKFIQSLPS